MTKIIWQDEIDNIKGMLDSGNTIEQVGSEYGVSRQRIYQVLTKFGLQTNGRKVKNLLRDLPPKMYWLNKMLCTKGFNTIERQQLLADLEVPDICPILGMELNYLGVGEKGWTRGDDSPSIDRIDSSKGYEVGNIHVISWRANRIKNDSTLEELQALVNYFNNLTK